MTKHVLIHTETFEASVRDKLWNNKFFKDILNRAFSQYVNGKV